MPLLFLFIYLFLNINNVRVTLSKAPFISWSFNSPELPGTRVTQHNEYDIEASDSSSNILCSEILDGTYHIFFFACNLTGSHISF